MRLIDADKLKIRETWALVENVSNTESAQSYDMGIVPKGISFAPLSCVLKKDIDNAPTAEHCYQTTSCLDCGNYDKENHNCPRYCEVIKEAINSRPQGEWKIIEHETLYLMGIYQCNLCSYKYICPDEFARNYCPNCGAEMQKGGAE